jgi:hypothetical protein
MARPTAVQKHAEDESPKTPRLKPFAKIQSEMNQRPLNQTAMNQDPPNQTATTSTQGAPAASEWHRLAAPASPSSASSTATPPAPADNSSASATGASVTVIPGQAQVSAPGSAAAPAGSQERRQRDQVAILRPEASPEIGTVPTARQPSTVTLTSGTQLSIRLAEALTSDRNRAGDNFFASLDRPLVIDGLVIAERNARVEGRVVDAQLAGHAKGAAQLTIELTKVHASDGQVVPVHTAPYVKQGPDPSNGTIAKVGGGAAIGAIIGAIAGGGKGAAIGAGVGGAAGGGTVAATRGKPVALPVETLLTFRVDQPVTITEQLR